MGEVFRARDTRLDRSVAVKVLPDTFSNDPKLKLRFEREARMISQLNHPNICTLHDVGHESGVDFLVMELCEGQVLADRLRKGPLPLEQALRIGIQIADALERAHAGGIIHRDLKPGNIILTRTGAKLLDFGLAKELTSRAEAELTSALTAQKPLTEEGTILGTFHYMSPEQLEGRDSDARSDVFALGVVLYEMVTGTRAFDGRTRASVIAAVLERDPPPPSQLLPVVPATLDRIIAACLEKSPDERWQSAHDLRRELEWLLEGTDAEPVRTGGTRGKRIGLAAAAAIFAASLATAGTFWFMRERAETPRRIVSTISAPRGTQFTVTGDAAGPVTLSPDGKSVAFTAAREGDSLLWVQSLESGTARALPGTSNAMFPFWSPDSRSIGYFANGRLLAIDVNASNPRQIASAPDGRGGLWTPDGSIIFTPYTQTGLYRVSADGGSQPVQITFPESPYTTHRWPTLIAGGFAYLAALHGSPSSPETAIFAADLDGGNARKLINATSSAIVYGEYLLYVRGQGLVAQKLADGQLLDPVQPVLDGVLIDPGTWRSIFSVSDNGLLVAHPAGEEDRNLRLRWLRPDGTELGDGGETAIYRDLALSPDGQKLATTIGDPNSQLYILDLQRGVRTRFSTIDSVSNPVWTPDGESIIFQYLMKSGAYEMVIKPADGRERERTLVSAPYALQPTTVDLERGVVLYNALLPEDTDVMAVPLAGGEPETIFGGPGQQMNAVISPDGNWIVYIETSNSGRYAYVTSYPTGGARWQISEDATYFLWWTKNGNEIRYLRDDGQLKWVPLAFDGGVVQVGAPEGGVRLNVNTNRRPVTMTVDSDRLLAATLTAEDPGPATLVVNFDSELD